MPLNSGGRLTGTYLLPFAPVEAGGTAAMAWGTGPAGSADALTAPPDRGYDLVNNAHQVGIVLEHDPGFFEDARALDVDPFGAVHKNVAYGRILEQRFQRTETEDLGQNLKRKSLFLRTAKRCLQIRRQFLNYRVHLTSGLVVGLRCHFLQIDVFQQFAMDSDLQVLIDVELQAASFLRFT